MEFKKINNRIFQLKVPFEDIYTSVFLLKVNGVNALIDCATYDSDVDGYIIPSLKNVGLNLKDIKYLILTHDHLDHSGGKQRLLKLNPNLEVITAEQNINLKGIEIYHLKGHTLDCIGVFDEESKTLISGDGLQGCCVGKYSCTFDSKEEYLKTISKIENDKRIKNLILSHAYEPWNKDAIYGRKEVCGRNYSYGGGFRAMVHRRCKEGGAG